MVKMNIMYIRNIYLLDTGIRQIVLSKTGETCTYKYKIKLRLKTILTIERNTKLHTFSIANKKKNK